MTSRAFCFAMIKGWSWKAILGGVALNIIGFKILSTLVLLYNLFQMASQAAMGGALDVILYFVHFVLLFLNGEMGGQVEVVPATSLNLSLTMLPASLIDLAAGYLVANWTPQRKRESALVVGFSLVIIRLCCGGFYSTGPIWFRLSAILALPITTLGGYWPIKTYRSQSAVQPKLDSSGSPPLARPF